MSVASHLVITVLFCFAACRITWREKVAFSDEERGVGGGGEKCSVSKTVKFLVSKQKKQFYLESIELLFVLMLLELQTKGFPLISLLSNRPFYQYGGHIEFITFEEYYGMPRGALAHYLPALFGQKENFNV